MIDPKKIIVEEKEYIISKFPATVGREIITQYPLSNLPKIGEYKKSHELMQKTLSYVAVEIDGQQLKLTTDALIDSHVKSATALIKLEKEMFAYNFDFFTNGDLSDFLTMLEKVAGEKATVILTSLLDKLSVAGKQLSTN